MRAKHLPILPDIQLRFNKISDIGKKVIENATPFCSIYLYIVNIFRLNQ